MKKSIRDNIISSAILVFIIGCSTINGNHRPLAVKEYIPLPYIEYKHDTIRIRPKQLSEAEKQVLVDKFYKYGYDKYYAPEFLQLNKIIATQAASIRGLSAYQVQTRHRTDSIAKERNYYREQWQKGQDTSVKYQKEVIGLLKIHNAENEKDIKINFILAVACIIGVLILVILWISLYLTVLRLKRTLHA